MTDTSDVTQTNQSESSINHAAEKLQFYPSDCWGLNYYFRIFNKMYICDIVNMSEYPLFPVDDGTGVISCCCWRNDLMTGNNNMYVDEDLPDILRRKSREITELNQSDGHTLGDLIQVRGKIKTYLGQKEIIASYHNKVDNPMYEVARMAELPKLYKQNYDKPFKLPRKVAQEIEMMKQEEVTGVKSQRRVIKELRQVLLAHFDKIQLTELSTLDMLQLDPVKEILDQVNSCNDVSVTANDIGILRQTLHSLEEEGLVCKKSSSSDCDDDIYEILSKHSMLEQCILKILITCSSKPKYFEKGCHYYHILDELHKTCQYSKVNKNCMLYCLNKLETQSDIIRTTPYHYLAYNT